jgi:hypothetical protein
MSLNKRDPAPDEIASSHPKPNAGIPKSWPDSMDSRKIPEPDRQSSAIGFNSTRSGHTFDSLTKSPSHPQSRVFVGRKRRAKLVHRSSFQQTIRRIFTSRKSEKFNPQKEQQTAKATVDSLTKRIENGTTPFRKFDQTDRSFTMTTATSTKWRLTPSNMATSSDMRFRARDEPKLPSPMDYDQPMKGGSLVHFKRKLTRKDIDKFLMLLKVFHNACVKNRLTYM